MAMWRGEVAHEIGGTMTDPLRRRNYTVLFDAVPYCVAEERCSVLHRGPSYVIDGSSGSDSLLPRTWKDYQRVN